MIARIWHGKTHVKDFDRYTDFLRRVAVPDYRSVAGNQGLTFLRRKENNEAHFTLITYWESIDAIKKFAGVDYEKAKYYTEDHEFLLEFEEKVVHHEIFEDLPA
ncbi:MAG: antibiotic biosynthesis monooxygenase [Bacteroidota bacterium]